MSRSQRHKVIIQGTDSSGKGMSEKQPALRYINQYANSVAFSVPTGAVGGPLQGSSTAGFPPTLIPPPTSLMLAEFEAGEDFSSPGQFDNTGNPIHESLPASNEPTPEPPGPGPDPEPGMEPTLASLTPDTAVLGDPDLTLHCIGTNFTETSVINFADHDEPTTFVSDTEVTTGVKPSLGWGAVSVPVTIKQGSFETAPLDFTFTEAAARGSQRDFPIGPLTISHIEDHADGLALTIASGDVRVDDTVLIEATGNTSVNGSYPVLLVDGQVIVVDNQFVLETPIDAKGRVTVISGEA